MLIVAGTMVVRPEDRDAYLTSRIPVVAATLLEPGCLDYAFSADLLEPGYVRVFERWASPEALEVHLGVVAERAVTAPPPVPVLERRLVRYEVLEPG